MAREIARALDERKEAIQAVARALPPSQHYRVVQLGPTIARELILPFEASDEWEEDQVSWQGLYAEFQSIRDQPVGRQWASLDSSVRFLLSDDEGRIKDGENYYLDRDAALWLSPAEKSAAECAARADCAEASFDEATLAKLKGDGILRVFLDQIANAASPEKKHEKVASFAKRLANDLRRFGFRPNSSVTRPSASEFVVSLDPGPFAGHEEELAAPIESTWRSEKYSLKVNWTQASSRSDGPEVFRILLGNEAGARSWVDFNERFVQLYPLVRLQSIAHEIGHVLGFKDRYYTLWNDKSCEYVIQSNPGDLMSDPGSGHVTEEHWAELDRRYPFKPAGL